MSQSDAHPVDEDTNEGIPLKVGRGYDGMDEYSDTDSAR
jgi:hypothetical protein